ncbi:chemotaxis response regulator protein-glutamate methylesterase [Candidatus Wolfebacteria bacterium]|nr:chemotaxis response regulator protein-glutamate methylesterase [Candidatus Wolfebacteria bacterium]
MNNRDKISVLIVDDSFFFRKIIRDILSFDSDIKVVGEVVNGKEAVKEAQRLNPDVITMDYLMPVMDGLTATKEIIKTVKPLPAIIMLSAITERGAYETLMSLNAGAVDFILKPFLGESELEIEKIAEIEKIKEELIIKIKIAARANIYRFGGAADNIFSRKKENYKEPSKIIIIGASTGGPPLLENILVQIPVEFSGAILIIQHMPAYFTKIFSQRLNEISKIIVEEAKEGRKISAGLTLVAPGDFQMGIKKGKILLIEKNYDSYFNPSIDFTMSSCAAAFKDKIVGIILSGMGEDGKEGIKSLKAAGGYIIAQDPETAVVGSMPESIIKEGLTDEIIPPNKIAKRIMELS